jgi:putative glycosyltransferase
MKVSIVTSLYLSAPYVREFHARHLACLEQLGVDYEFVFVDDGSPDDARAVTSRLAEEFPNIKLVCLSRNFGQHAAMFAGMEFATGDYVCAVDCDLEEAPENIVVMYRLMREDPDVDVVYGVLRTRPGGFVRNLLARTFYRLQNSLSRVTITPNQAWQRLMTRDYVRALLRYGEGETLPAGLMALAGFNQKPFPMEKSYKGSTSYSFRKRLRLALNSLTAFSSRPLELIGMFGIAVTVISFAAIAVLVALKLAGYDFETGWPSVIASVWCVGGLILTSVGVVGIYLAKVFNQVKNRPLYVVKRVIESPPRSLRAGETARTSSGAPDMNGQRNSVSTN